jgi:hypothetical protein
MRVEDLVIQKMQRLSAATLCLLILSCSKPPAEWQEEVKLSSGKVIVISRQTDYVSGGAEWAQNPDLQTPDICHLRFTYPVDSGSQVEWRSKPESRGLYPESPLVFDLENGAPVVIAVGSRSRQCPEYRRYIYLNSTWKRQPLLARDWDRKSNLLFDSSNEYLITLEKKEQMNASGSYAKWLKNIDPSVDGCHELSIEKGE